MPLSAVCVSTVGGRPRAWSSYTNLQVHNVPNLRTMNSTEELPHREIGQNPFSPTKKTAYFEYDISDDKPVKKEKKWSFGNLFRRKKKNNDSSSEEDLKKNSTDKKKRKSEKKKPVTFDHVVITKPQVKTAGLNANFLSDHSEKINSYNRVVSNETSFQHWDFATRKNPTQLSLDNVSRRSRRELTKVRAEARRTSLNRNSSSDDDSQVSNSSHKFRSDESLAKSKDCSKRSRTARTERYLKRHSRDGENPNNYLRVSKSDAESFLKLSDESTRSPSVSPSQFKLSFSSVSSQSPSVIGLSTIPPSHVNHSRFRVSNSTSNPSYKPPLSMNEYNNTARNSSSLPSDELLNNHRSISFDADIHRPDVPVLHARLQLGKPRSRNFTIVDGSHFRNYCNMQQPPPPPPRDPRRMTSMQYLDTVNQNSSSHLRCNGVGRMNSLNLNPAFKSSSEDHIPRHSQISLVQRPASATPDVKKVKSDNYQYLTDKQPRSRKPIFIQNGINKSFSQKEVRETDPQVQVRRGSTTFLDQLRAKKSKRDSGGNSPQFFSSETTLKSQIFLPSVLPNNNIGEQVEKPVEAKLENLQAEEHLDRVNQNTNAEESLRRRSTNLEEALNELEAIYNSLKLGDENLLDMAEQREKEVATQKLLEKKGYLPNWYTPRGTLSDSGFNYEPFDSIDASKRRRYSRQALKSDDMAFRKINREDRAATITDPQNVSYLLTSPIYSGEPPFPDEKIDPNEPDVTLDDVVYRSIKQMNKLKVPEHPPPFGIPLGPITPAANSDYLHAVPDEEVVKPSRIPDVVKDDLAYRNLRKDGGRDPILPPVSAEDLRNNNLNLADSKTDPVDLKKRRAGRSKSANIGSLISQEVIERAGRRNARDKNIETEYKTLTDIADAMQIAREVLKEKERRISDTKQASMSDTEANCLKYTRYNYARKVSPPKQFVTESVPVRKSPVKEMTPDPQSSFEDGRLGPLFRSSSFENALTALAIEAKEASDKFTQDLENLDLKHPEVVSKEPVDLCEKLREAVIDSAQRIASFNMAAKEKQEENEEEIKESVASIVLSMKPSKKTTDCDYENLCSDIELDKGETGKKSPFEENKIKIIESFNKLSVDADRETCEDDSGSIV